MVFKRILGIFIGFATPRDEMQKNKNEEMSIGTRIFLNGLSLYADNMNTLIFADLSHDVA
jgi:hypothetical protein